MVVIYNFQDIFEESSKVSMFTLPTHKENNLKLEYENLDNVTTLSTVFRAQESSLPFAASDVFYANICDHRRLTAIDDGCKAVYEITFDIAGSNFNFRPGDTIGIIPHNTSEDINLITDRLNLSTQLNVPYKLSCIVNQKGVKIPANIPVKSTLKHVLEYCVDLRSVVKKLFLFALSSYTKDENERRVLEYMCSKEGSVAYNTHILNHGVCILDIFAMFKSCKPPIEVLLSHLPRLLPRPYSIINTNIKDRNTLKICFSVITLNKNRKGLTTGWLEEMILRNSNIENQMENLSINDNINNKVPIYLRKNLSGFSLPINNETPLLMIGPGTGISPYMGFLEERQYIKEKYSQTNMGFAWLFFGCRNPSLDFIYEQELKTFQENGSLNKLSTAFSRVKDCGSKYIQDILIENGEDIIKLIKDGASIFVCGDLKNMGTQVKDTIKKCIMKHDNKSAEEAEKILSDMQKEKRYLIDSWN
ncbi:methionine synthase reductase [Galleria mellonella]|uniref:Methionine synthase reductase n=1 Tax=Galleria mellonella TaxID=7137 RepID=A0A6J1WEU2_GALME|nr:methionine synthase reductase [Galleria mellonella]